MPCTAKPPCRFEEVPLEDISVEWGGESVGKKALAWPAQKRISIDPAFWRSLRTIDARKAILAHERGHIEGARCESCADFRAGEILRREGTPNARDAARAMAGRLENRDADAAAADLLRGYGFDDLNGPGFLLNAARAEGVKAPKVRAFLGHLHTHGLTYQGKTYRLTVGVDGGNRDDAVQLRLYSQGRALVGGVWTVVDASKVVTNARTAAQTRHGQGRAVDVWVMLDDGKPLLFPSQAPALFEGVYRALGELGESMGLDWGGRWTSLVDRPHFEDPSFISTTAAVGGGAVILLLVVLTVALS